MFSNQLYFKTIIYLVLVTIFSQNVIGQRISERKFLKIIQNQEALKGSIVSAVFYDLEKNKNIVDFQSDKFMTPASNMKLFTFLAAITSFDSIPSLHYKKIEDKFYFWSSGYPLLAHPKYADSIIVPFLSKQKDSLIYIDTKMESSPLGPGWAWDDKSYYFSAERSTFPFHGNVVGLIKNTNNDSIEFSPRYFSQNKSEIKINSPIEEILRNTKNDTLYIPFSTNYNLFTILLSQQTGRSILYSDNTDPSQIKQYSSLYSGQEKTLYKALLHHSDNLIAESLMLMVSAKNNNRFNINIGINSFVEKELSRIKSPPIWHDGSGLSRYNMATSKSIIYVLEKIYKKIGLKEIEALFPSINNTSKGLSYEFLNKEFRVYAKTGTLKNNHCLSGYIIKSKKIILFSVMVNHYNSKLSDIQKAIGAIVELVINKV